MNRTTVYDLPTRFFHWIFAGLFISAFLIAKTVDDESPVFSYHMIFGILLVVAVLLRVIWGFVGTRYARFDSFDFAPTKAFAYFKGVLSGKGRLEAGHNPASSWASVIMFLLALGLGISGFLMSQGNEIFEEVHEVCGTLMVLTAIGHVVGIAIHTFQHKDPIALSMISGKKNVPSADGIQSTKPVVGVVFVLAMAYLGVHLYRNFDQTSRQLNLFGYSLLLGESEGEGGKESEGGKEDKDD